MKAMILAAGLGSRMAPISARRAKATLPVLDEPLVLRQVRTLAAQGVEHVIVNAHAFPEQIREALAKAPIPIQISFEAELRGSAGGILQARAFLDGSEPFFVLNADMWVDLDLRALLEAHARLGAIATLVLRDETREHEFGTIGYAEGARVSRITDLVDRGAETGSGLFAGVQVVEPEIFSHMPERDFVNLMSDVYAPLLERGEALAAWLQPAESPWWPVGTPRELVDANLRALDRQLEAAEGAVAAEDARIEGELRGPVWVGSGARVTPGAVAGPRAVIGAGAVLPRGSHATESLLLPGARPEPGARLQRAIAYDNEVWRDA